MPQNQFTAWYKRETQIFREFVHVDGEKKYKRMITKIKSGMISLGKSRMVSPG